MSMSMWSRARENAVISGPLPNYNVTRCFEETSAWLAYFYTTLCSPRRHTRALMWHRNNLLVTRWTRTFTVEKIRLKFTPGIISASNKLAEAFILSFTSSDRDTVFNSARCNYISRVDPKRETCYHRGEIFPARYLKRRTFWNDRLTSQHHLSLVIGLCANGETVFAPNPGKNAPVRRMKSRDASLKLTLLSCRRRRRRREIWIPRESDVSHRLHAAFWREMRNGCHASRGETSLAQTANRLDVSQAKHGPWFPIAQLFHSRHDAFPLWREVILIHLCAIERSNTTCPRDPCTYSRWRSHGFDVRETEPPQVLPRLFHINANIC